MTDPAGNPLRLMLVHAHPDDETTTTGATIARYAAEGVGVELVTCTRGERGEMLAPDLAAQLSDPDPDKAARLLAGHRERELAEACQALGIGPARFLGGAGRWWDSGMAGEVGNQHGRALAAGDLAEQAAELVELIHTIRPQVIVTYDERGGYGHPDHIRAHDITLAAVDSARSGWPVSRVYAAVVPRSAILRGAELLGGSQMSGENPFAGVADPQSLPFLVADEDVTAVVDARAYAAHKIAAMRAHRTQMPPDGWFFLLAEAIGAQFGMEHYQLLRADGTVPEGVIDDLFAGLRA
jgi:N-acetyl-1-D-myo-inositol-2-amino-2-deoxy-alpha-D-glucopyranoside deacetylase